MFGGLDPELEAGLARVQQGSNMSDPVPDKEEGWEGWLREWGLWGEEKSEEANYLRYR